MVEPLAAAIAFFALGANLIGVATLVVFNPRSRAVRWFAVFEAGLIVWLLCQGVIALGGDVSTWGVPFAAAVTLLPALFLAASIMEGAARPLWHGLAIVGIAAAFAPLGVAEFFGRTGPLVGMLVLVWHVAGWTIGSVIHFRRRSPLRSPAGLDRVITVTLLAAAPALVAAGFLLGGDGFFVYVVPSMTVVIQLLILVGVATMRFYDIDVRVARTGELAAEAARIERLAVLGELAATVAHEVRNPLTGMRSLAQRLADDDIGDAKRRSYARVMLEETDRVERMVANLLGLAKRAPRGSASAGPTPLEPLLEDLRLLTGARADRRGVRLRLAANGLAARAPREALTQVLLNLLLNAIDHSPTGGTVDVTAEARAAGIELRVRDQGPGVPAETRERIFEPFHAGDGGTGLGLSVVRSLARDHGWQVEVADAPGGGAEFRVRVARAGVSAETQTGTA